MEQEKLEFIRRVAELTPESQNRFFEEIRGIVTEKELEALQIAVGCYSLFADPVKMRAVQESMAAQVYAEMRDYIHYNSPTRRG